MIVRLSLPAILLGMLLSISPPIPTTTDGIAPTRKCASTVTLPGIEEKMPVYLVDGGIVDIPDGNTDFLAKLDIDFVDITCWSPETGEFSRRPGVSVVYMTTKASTQRARDPIEQLVQAQEAYLAEHGSYATSLDELVSRSGPSASSAPYENIDFISYENGWSASTVEGVGAIQCSAFQGEIDPGFPVLSAGTILCENDYSIADRTLRARLMSGPTYQARRLTPPKRGGDGF